MIQIKDLSVFYRSKDERIRALGPVSFTGEREDIFAIIGPSGCGKSTLLSVLSGINKKYEGEISLNGEKLNPHIHTIGFIPQNFGLLPWKTVEENLLLPYRIKGMKIGVDIIEKMDRILERLNIKDFKHRYPISLSGGQKQRVSIARSFLMEQDILLMDEPFSALDAIIREEAGELFLEIWNENKRTTFFVTHSIDEALYIGKKIIIMSSSPGEILEIRNNDLFNNKNYKEDERYSNEFSYIKNLIKKGWK